MDCRASWLGLQGKPPCVASHRKTSAGDRPGGRPGRQAPSRLLEALQRGGRSASMLSQKGLKALLCTRHFRAIHGVWTRARRVDLRRRRPGPAPWNVTRRPPAQLATEKPPPATAREGGLVGKPRHGCLRHCSAAGVAGAWGGPSEASRSPPGAGQAQRPGMPYVPLGACKKSRPLGRLFGAGFLWLSAICAPGPCLFPWRSSAPGGR